MEDPLLMEDHTLMQEYTLMEDNSLMEDCLPTHHNDPTINSVATSTELLATGRTANTSTDVNTVVGPTLVGAAPCWGSPELIKPPPWTPLQPFILELWNYPDRVFVRQLIDNLRQGCAIGCNGPHFTSLAPNLRSAFQQPEVIDATLRDECEAGRILGPFDQPPFLNFCTSGLGLVPKHDRKWRIIYHLSAPFAQSINSFIDPSSYSLSYCTIDDAYQILNKFQSSG